MRRRIAVTALLLTVAGMWLTSVAAAQMTRSMMALNASLTLDGKVALKWSEPAGDSVRYYSVYRAGGMNILTFTRIDSTRDDEFTDTPPWTGLVVLYTYYVEASMKGGATLRSTMATVNLSLLPRGDIVRITSDPVRTARIGVPYVYQVHAVSSDSTALLTYGLLWHPDGMTIDSTGRVSWMPDRKGFRSVQIGVTSSKGGRTSQQYTLTVTGPEGTIAGAVTDTSGNPIPRVTVQFFARDRENHFEYTARTDSAGHYILGGVDYGTYIARALPSGNTYLSQWYDNAATADKAAPIVVNDSPAVTVNFMLHARMMRPSFTVSGTVVDTLGQPVKDSWVTFTASSFCYNSSRPTGNWTGDDDHRDMFDAGQRSVFAMGVPGGMMGMGTTGADMSSPESLDFRLDGTSAFVFRTKVDTNGAYSLKLPQGSYIAEASAPGYYRLFYNNRSDFLSADIVSLTADTSGINFALQPIAPIAYGSITGSVVDSVSGAGVISRVLGFRLRVAGDDTLVAPRAYLADSDSLGSYSLGNLPPGSYVVLAIPLGHYVPSYYSLSTSTRRWKDATKIQVNGTTVAGIVISVVPMLRGGTGYTSVTGSVQATAGVSGSLGKLSASSGVDGSLVYAVDNSSGQVAGYGITNSDGSFTIAELAPGSYTVTVDKVDYSSVSTSANPTYDPTTGNAVTSSVTMTIDAVVTATPSSDPIIPTAYSLNQNYPNPFNPSTQIVFSIQRSEKVSLVVYNILGQKIATLVDGLLSQGTHLVTWNGRDDWGRQLSSGVYFYMIETSGFTAARKMVLLK